MKTRAQMIEEAGFSPLGRYGVYWTVERKELDCLIAIVAEEACAELMFMHARTSDHNYYHFAANQLRERFKQEQDRG